MDFSKFLPNILPRDKIDKKLMRTFVKPERSAALSPNPHAYSFKIIDFLLKKYKLLVE